MYGRSRSLGRLARANSLRGVRLGDFDWSGFASTLANDAASVAKVAVQPTTSVNSSVSPTGVQTYSYSAPGIGTTTGVASLTGGSSGLIWIAVLGLGAILLLKGR